MLTRYKKVMSAETGYRDQMLARHDGNWVKYDEAQAEIARLQAEVDRLKEEAECDAKLKDDLYAQIITAHNAALEEAAKWCEENGMAINMKHQGPYSGYVSHPVQDTYVMRHEGKGYASAIRALARLQTMKGETE